jgi:hypothetical protein
MTRPTADAGATPQRHPTWCKLRRCAARDGGFHTSETITVAHKWRSGSTVRLRLRLYALDIGFPMIEILVLHLDGTPRTRIDLSTKDAAVLRDALVILLERTDT